MLLPILEYDVLYTLPTCGNVIIARTLDEVLAHLGRGRACLVEGYKAAENHAQLRENPG